MAVEVPFDVLEQILIGLDVKDLIRFKSVCKSWQSFISSPAFVKAHLRHDLQNTGDRRRISVNNMVSSDEFFFIGNAMYIAGSCNGLVCVSPKDVELEVTNPWTRETKKLQTPPCRPERRPNYRLLMIREVVHFLGFGYDASTDDYKVIAGFKNWLFEERTVFHVLTLKSNVWKVIGEFNYDSITNRYGVLCRGALHWFMRGKRTKKTIISLDLSTEEFKEIPYPAEPGDYSNLRLGVIEECLCICSYISPLYRIKWVMKNNKWELYNNESQYDVVRYRLSRCPVVESRNRTRYVYTHDDGRLVPSFGEHIRASVFVKSLVSPHPHKGQLEVNGAQGNIRKRKRSSKHKSAPGYELLVRQLQGSGAKGKIRKRTRRRSSKHKRALVL